MPTRLLKPYLKLAAHGNKGQHLSLENANLNFYFCASLINIAGSS